MQVTESLKSLFIDTATSLKSSARRVFMARTIKELGRGGQRYAERELGWNRKTIRKGMHEWQSGFTCADGFRLRGRKRAEEHLPNLVSDIRDIVDSQSQTDPKFRTNRLYTRLSAAEIRRQLVIQKGYKDEDLPCEQTIRNKLSDLGYSLRKVAKIKPQKKFQKPMLSSRP